MTGKINRILHVKGYGFITDSAGLNRFMHVRDLRDELDWPHLREGQLVEFEPVDFSVLRKSQVKKAHNGLSVSDVRLA